MDELEEEMNAVKANKYEPANLEDLVRQQDHLDATQQQSLLNELRKHEDAFQGRAGQWNGEPIVIKLKEGVKLS